MTIRAAMPADTGELVRLRLAMQREVGDLPKDADPAPQEEANRRYFEDTLATGEFRAWVAEAAGRLVACSGLVLFRRPPSRRNLSGWEGYLMNMYTEPAWRGRGLATALLSECVSYVKSQTPARRIRLHATAAGRLGVRARRVRHGEREHARDGAQLVTPPKQVTQKLCHLADQLRGIALLGSHTRRTSMTATGTSAC